MGHAFLLPQSNYSIYIRPLESPFWIIFINVCMLWSWNLQDMLESPLPFFIGKEPGEIMKFKTLINSRLLIFTYFLFVCLFVFVSVLSKSHFSGSTLWRPNYETPRPQIYTRDTRLPILPCVIASSAMGLNLGVLSPMPGSRWHRVWYLWCMPVA